MYKNIKTSVKVDCIRLKRFNIKVGVHQGSITSLLPLAVVINKVTKDIKDVIKEFLYKDDLVLFKDIWEVEPQYFPGRA